MQSDFTQNDILSFLYNESDLVTSLLVEDAMNYDYELKEEYQMLKDSKELLESISYSPSTASVDLILAISELNQDLVEA